MDGKSLLYSLRNLLNESSTSGFLNTRSSYEFLWEAAKEFVKRTKCLHATQTITTVASQSSYTLNADFLALWLTDQSKEYVIRYTSSGSLYRVKLRDYGRVLLDNSTTSASVPSYFALIDNETAVTRITGTATGNGAKSGGEAILTDSAGDFSNAAAGDIVHNTTDGSVGYVLSKTSSTQLVTALFDGANDDWSTSDAYVIQPQTRIKLTLDPPPSSASDTVTFDYVQAPAPVFSDYGIYRIPEIYQDALVKYAAWLYKFRDREPNFGDVYYRQFDSAVRRAAEQYTQAFGKTKIHINLGGNRY